MARCRKFICLTQLVNVSMFKKLKNMESGRLKVAAEVLERLENGLKKHFRETFKMVGK